MKHFGVQPALERFFSRKLMQDEIMTVGFP